MPKLGLIPKLLIGLAIGIAIGLVGPDWLIRLTETGRVLLGGLIKFLIPLIIISFVATAISEFGQRAGKLLSFTVGISYLDTIIACALGAVVAYIVIPLFSISHQTGAEAATIGKPFIEIEMPPIMSVMSALLIAFVVGIGATTTKGTVIKNAMGELRDIIFLCINKVILPILPFFIGCIFAGIAAKGELFSSIGIFAKMLILIIIMQIVWLIIEYLLAGMISRNNPWTMFKAMIPAYFTAMGTMSSAATLPVALKQAKSVPYMKKGIADFVIPLCNTVHLSGAAMAITISAFTVSQMTTGQLPPISVVITFIILLGIIEVGAVGVPGGSVLAALGILQSSLGFDEAALGLMLTLFMIQDSFGTATNVVGDGAIGMIVNKFFGKEQPNDIEGDIGEQV